MDVASKIGIALNVGRVAYGVAAIAAPAKATEGWIGRTAHEGSAAPMIRAFGIRDVALGAATIGALRATGSGGTGAKMLLALGVMVDTTDAVSGFVSKDDVPDPRSIYAVAGGAAVAGALALTTANDDAPDA